MKRKPIYVELNINTDMEKLWSYTQSAEKHEQWDLRFSSITYLPRQSEDSPQAFLYETRIGFGLRISGTGRTKSSIHRETGVRLSTLAFGSKQPISLIRHGAGYWQYRPNKDSITFLTKYDYATRFGRVGKWFDRLLFRPIFGWATALSFDILRLWLEKQIPPCVSVQRIAVHYISIMILGFLWLYEGLVPKWIYPEAGELAIMQNMNMFPGAELLALKWLGGAEILLGLLLLLYHRSKWLYGMQLAALIALTASAMVVEPTLLAAPFNPFVLGAAMLGLSMIGMWTCRELPNAGNCIRKKGELKP
ncbi:DoxX-like family protein [Paenibacillus glycanilyticus]|uniref:DoxX-like family protein n=1 Tax=Paenibacillus glycanilyticus TaxID=126569 RepID=UPI00203C166A|nr:DoxX-like family protein [Paenibacillus glycanilyticus]MCM3628648.1 DoxX-like family protein [Paenibacillus glycanilyticus]